MEAKETDLFRLLDGSKHFVIPHYQRLYSWESKHCVKLFEDIANIALDANKRHFVGSIVYVSHVALADGVNTFVVIDGQQRLTTVSLMLLALVDQMADEPSEKRKRLNRTIRNADEELTSDFYFKLKLTRSDNGSFREIVRSVERGEPLKSDESRVHRNYLILRDLISKSDFAPEDLLSAISRLDLVYIALDANRDDPQAIFESLNSTGKNLSATDLIRNFVMMDQLPQVQADLYENYWLKLENIFKERSESEFEDLTRAFLALKQGKYPLQADVFESFKLIYRSRLEAGVGAAGALGEFRDAGKSYAQIQWLPEPKNKNLQDALSSYRSLRNKVLNPLAMPWATRDVAGAVYEGIDLAKVLGLLESYLVRRVFCGLRNNGLDQTVAKAFELMKKSKRDGVEAVADAMLSIGGGKGRFPLDEEVLYKGQTFELYNSNLAEYILGRLEKQLDPKGTNVNVKATVEHIMPQTLTNIWKRELGPDFASVRERLLHTIGNLTLSPYNSELGNLSFRDKVNKPKFGFRDSKFALSRPLVEEAQWGEPEITARGQRLMALVVKAWPLPSIYTENYIRIESQVEKEEISVLDLVTEGLLDVGDELYWSRPQVGEVNVATIAEGGQLRVSDGDLYESPTAATRHFTTSNYNGWKQWRMGSEDGPTLDELRERLSQANVEVTGR